ncbi:MAG: cysteine desulfurase [Rhizobiales bacterium]|nr:cysteine desulfurase [Hyphomicrobiales bacterium]
MERIYLDYNASAPLLEPVKAAMIEAFDVFGNGSSVHSQGRKVHGRIETAREQVAKMVGARGQDVIFTSGGTEANNLALTPSLFPKDLQSQARLYVSAIEHPSILNGMRFEKDQITVIPVTREGVVDVEWLRNELLNSEDAPEELNKNEPHKKHIKPILVSVMAANNETGIIQPITEISEIVHEAGGLLHSDCVQVLGKMPLLLPMTNADLISVSAHKIGGPQGVGALILRDASVVLREPHVAGGGQELKRRGGTENMAGIVGFGVACEVVNDTQAAEQGRIKDLRDQLEVGLLDISPDAVVFGKDVQRLGNVCCFAVPGFSAETQVIQLDLMNISLSSGSACSSGKVDHSHVLKAMAVKETISHAALRVSLGPQSSLDDVNGFLKAWESIYTRAKKRGHAA